MSIGKAKIEIVADASGFGSTASAQVTKALDGVAAEAAKAFDSIEVAGAATFDPFARAADTAARDTAAAMDKMSSNAKRSGDDIGRSLEQGMSGVDAAAKRAAADVAAAMDRASESGGRAGRSIGDDMERGLGGVEGAAKRASAGIGAQMDKIKASGKQAADDVESSFKGWLKGAEDETDNLIAKIGGIGLAVTAAGTVGGGLVLGLDVDNEISKMNAQLGYTGELAAATAASVGESMRSGVASSAEEAAGAIGALEGQFKYLGSEGEQTAAALSDNMLAFAKTFEVDIAEATQTVGQLIANGLAPDVESAADMMTTAMQRFPAAMRDELPEILNEYGTNFRALGFEGEEMFNLLISASAQGKFALDKTGDSLKEFTIRGADMSKTSVDAYEAIGLSAADMSAAVAAGGDGAQDALQKVATGLLGIDDPAERANQAIALFGTPLEDLSVDQIPAFLKGLSGADDEMQGFAGSSQAAADTIANSFGGRVDALKGTLGMLAREGFMVAWDAAQKFGGWVRDNQAWLGPLALGIAGIAAAITVFFIPSMVAAGTSATIEGAKIVAAWFKAGAASWKSLGQTALAAAGVVASWIGMAVAAMANAVVMAAAWFIALGPIAWVIAAIVGVVAVFAILWNTSDGFRNFWIGLWDTIKNAASDAWIWIQETWATYGQPIIDWVMSAFSALGDGIALYFRLMGAAWEVLLTGLRMAWDAWGQPIVDWVVRAFQSLSNGVSAVFGWISGKWNELWTFLGGIWAEHGQPIVDRIASGFTWLQFQIDRALYYVKAYIHLAGAVIGALYDKYVQPMVDSVTNGFNRVMDTIRGWKDNIIGWFKDAGTWLLDAGKNIIGGIIEGIKSRAGALKDAFLNMVPEWVKGPFREALGIASPSKLFAEYGANIGQGLVQGIASMNGAVETATGSLAGAAMAGVPAAGLAAPVGAVAPIAPVAGAGAPVDGAVGPLPELAAPAVQGLGQVLTDTKVGVIDPALLGLQENALATATAFATDVTNMATTFTGTATQVATQVGAVVNPAVNSMGMNLLGTKAGVIDPALAGINGGIANTAATFNNQINGGVIPAVNRMGTGIMAVKQGSIDPAFAGIQGGLANTVNAFANGTNAINTHMNKIREGVAAPVRFAIGPVFNDGLVGMWNSVSDMIGTTKMNPYPVRFASGGFVTGAGGPTEDKIPALLSNREYVVNAAAVEKIGVDNLNALNSGQVSVARGAFKNPAERRALLQDKTFQQYAARYAGGGLVQGSPAWEQLRRGYDWARQLNGRPYVLGGDPVGGGGTDCSGYMSSIADKIQGGAGHRKWATMSFNGGGNAQHPTGPQGFVQGLAAGFSVGVKNGGAAGGHTAGTIGGVEGLPSVNVESGGSPSRVKFGTGAVGADHGQFPTQYHLPVVEGGMFASGGGGSGPSMGEVISGMVKPMRDKISGAAAQFAARAGLVNTLPVGVEKVMGDAMQKTIDKKLAEMMTDPGGEGAERWRPMAIRAMQHVGGFNWQDEAQITAMLKQIMSESTGNPNASQQIHDMNGTGDAAGVGLLQVIPGTWAASRDPSLPDDRRNPFANMVGALRYYKGRYGTDLTTMWGHGHGYHKGGLMGAGQGMFNKTAIEPEMVLSPEQTQAFVDWMHAGSGQGVAQVQVLDVSAAAQFASEVLSMLGVSAGARSMDVPEGRNGGDRGNRTINLTQHIYDSNPKGAAADVINYLDRW